MRECYLTFEAVLRHTCGMLVAFFESFKYSGHLFPVAFLRIFLGYHYLQESLHKIQGEYLEQPQLAGVVNEWLNQGVLPMWYQGWLESIVVPYWQVFAYLATVLQILVGISFIFGFLVRPFALVTSLLSLNLIFMADPSQILLQKVMFAVNFTLAWFGAGRCLGVDYFFFKKNRGIWW